MTQARANPAESTTAESATGGGLPRGTNLALLTGIACYVIWGGFPLFWPLLDAASPVEVLAHRMVWSCASALVVMLVVRHPWGWVKQLSGRSWLLLVAAAVVISFNWGGFIYAVNSGHVVESSLGYFINPLVSLVLGRVVFGERLDARGKVGAALAFAGVVIIAAGSWRTLWISLLLAGTFGAYGALKKSLTIPALPGLLVESGIMLVPSLIYLFVLESRGQGHWTAPNMWWLFMLGGLLTMVPLWLFAIAAKGLPLGTVGVLQYIAPTSQFLLGLFVFGQHVSAGYWAGLVVVWIGCLVYLSGMLRQTRRQ
ncbi:EamA family transporter RarD [Propionibacteriaceae bacterium G57]|uniref:EamA family transporter RarD n=1 Tax=Aestuariimicrobium sp. G57 TaxID=3418485 RepID=UPI003DA72C6F